MSNPSKIGQTFTVNNLRCKALEGATAFLERFDECDRETRDQYIRNARLMGESLGESVFRLLREYTTARDERRRVCDCGRHPKRKEST